ncbi:twin-arginine translocation signal domain-containing protein [Candidatus Woesearchaeota archaeon]|nr:twin-arginine translocation signal domain-containing protein [Candidatus Woesearchaeota archaeon]
MEKLDAKQVEKKFSRRDFLKRAAVSAGTGVAGGVAANYGLGKLADELVKAVDFGEKEYRELELNLYALKGGIEDRMATAADKLRTHHRQTKGILRKIDPDEFHKYDTIIKNCDSFREHYDFTERARIFKDRIDQKLYRLGSALYNSTPGFWQKNVNDRVSKLFLGDTAEQAQKQHYEVFVKRLDQLCEVYNANENNRIAETKVLERLDQMINAASAREKAALKHLRMNWKSGAKEDVIARAGLLKAGNLYARIGEARDYMLKFQDLLKKGLELKAQLRKGHETDVKDLNTQVNTMITELKGKSYSIETRQDYINSGWIAQYVRDFADRFVPQLSAVLGLGAAGTTLWYTGKNKKERALRAALTDTVDKYNGLVDKYEPSESRGETNEN